MEQHFVTYPLENPGTANITICRRNFPAGTAFPIHWHDYFELEYILEGEGLHTHNGTTSAIDKGCTYLMGFNDFHSFTAVTDVDLYSVHFSKGYLPWELEESLEFGKFFCQLSQQEEQWMVAALQQMRQELQTPQPFGTILVKGLLTEIIVALIRKSTVKQAAIMPPHIRRAIVYLNGHYREEITLDTLAEAVSLSPNYLGQIFKREVGVSVREYLNHLRLRLACDLLTSSDFTVKQIAFTSGYNSLEYFMYIFKKNFRMTPLQYRKGAGYG